MARQDKAHLDRYAAIVAKSIAAAGRDDHEARHAVYSKVRDELDRLIASAQPPMAAAEQITHQAALEQAIARIEQAYSARDHASGRATTEPKKPAAGQATGSGNGGPAAPKKKTSWFRKSAGRPNSKVALSPPVPESDEGPAPGRTKGTKPPQAGLRRFLRSRLGKVTAVVGVALLALLVGVWILLASLNAASVPDMDVVATRLAKENAATLFLGAATERFATNGKNPVSSTGSLFGRGAVRIGSVVKEGVSTGNTNVARIYLTPRIRKLLNEKTLRVTIFARSASRNPSPEMAVAVADGDETSDWQTFQLDDTFRPYEIEFTFPLLGSRKPVIAVWADPEGAGRAVEISEISLWIAPE